MTNNLDPQSPDPTSEDEAAQGPGGISPELLADPYGEEILDISAADFEALLSDHADVMGDFKEGEIVHAKVLRVTDSMVILEFGFKSEGAVPLDEFKDRDGIEPGQEVEVLLESLEDDDGIVVLSKKKADFLRVWEKIREAHEADEPVEGMLARKIKGGVTVDIMGVDAFLPGSQIALRRVPNIDDLLGQTFEFKIIKLNKRRRNIVVSRRVILEGERERKRETLVKELLVGQVRAGIVKNITDFGAFIDLGGLDGLLHITDMSWGAGRTSLRGCGYRCQSRHKGPGHRLGPRAYLIGPQAASALPVDRHRQEVPGRLPGARKGSIDYQLRSLHRAGEGCRGPRSYL